MSLGTDLAAAVALITTDSTLLRAIVQGPASGGTSIVTLPTGAQIKTLARLAQEMTAGHLPLAGGTLTGALNISGAAATNRSLLFQTVGVTRWAIRANTTAEGGANAGSNLAIEHYDDAGVLLGTALNINRATGSIGIGSTATAARSINITRPLGGASSAYALYVGGIVQPEVTATGANLVSFLQTAGASFNIAAFSHFFAWQDVIGSGSTVTSQYGLLLSSNMVGATNNYGVHSSIPSGSGRWFLYGSGAADCYIAGNFGFGNTTIDARVDVNGAIAITDGMTAPGATSGKAKLYVDSADGDFKIKFGDGTTKTIVVDT